jgi:hypothetical protein
MWKINIPALLPLLVIQGISRISCEDHEGGDPLDWLRNAIPGEPGVDYPIYSTVEQTSFSCDGLIFGGYYADPEMECQGYHVCLQDALTPDSLYPVSFLCPNGTIFSQEIFTCDWWYNVDCSAATGLYAGAEGAFGGQGGDGGDGGAGSCPAGSPLPADQCAGSVSNCWSPGFTDTDCPNNGLCCFDGCADTCVDGPKPVPAPAPAPAPPPFIENESAQQPQVVPLPGTTAAPAPATTEKVGYEYPVPENPLIIQKPPPGLPTLYGAPPPGRK